MIKSRTRLRRQAKTRENRRIKRQVNLAKVHIARGFDLILKNFGKIRTHPVSPDEISKSVNKIIGYILMEKENSLEISDHFGRQLLFRHSPIRTYSYLIQKYKAVTPADVQRVAKKYLKLSKMNVCTLGAVKADDIHAHLKKYQ